MLLYNFDFSKCRHFFKIPKLHGSPLKQGRNTRSYEEEGREGGWSTVNSDRICSQLREDLQCVDPWGVNWQPTQIGSAANSERIHIDCLSKWWLIDSQLREDLQPTQSGSLSPLNRLSILPHPQHLHHQDTFCFRKFGDFPCTLCLESWAGSTLCGSYLSWLWILSELALDQPSPQDQHTVDPHWVGCRSYLSWLSINPPQDQHTVDPLWVDCRSHLCWLSIDSPQINTQWITGPLWVGCRSYLSWLSSTPLRINTLWILSELAANPIWVGCWLTPKSTINTVQTDVDLWDL